MHVFRAMPFALGWLLAVSSARAQREEIPSIFSEVAPQRESLGKKFDVPEIVRPRLPLSNQVRSALNERVTVNAATVPAAARPAKWTWEDHSDAILMERFVVSERRKKKVEVVSVPSYLVKVLTTGEIFESERFSVYWGLSAAESTGYGSRGNTPRVGISATWRW